MSIPAAVHSQIPQWICAAASKITWENTLAYSLACSSGLEALFHASLVGGVQTNKYIRWVRDTCVTHFKIIQNLFTAANAVSIIYTSARIANELNKKFHITEIVLNSSLQDCTMKMLPVLLGSGACITLGIALWKTSTPSLMPARQQTIPAKPLLPACNVDITEDLSKQQQIARLCHIIKIVLNISLTCLTASPLGCVMTLATSAYTLLKNRKLTRINLAFNIPASPVTPMPYPDVTSMRVTYRMLKLPVPESAFSNECRVCRENDVGKVAFCVNHLFCQNCVIRHILDQDRTLYVRNAQGTSDPTTYSKFHLILRSSDYLRILRHDRDRTSYSISVPHENLPNCPDCRAASSPYHTLDVEMQEAQNKTFNARVRIKPPVDAPVVTPSNKQTLFANLYAAYNVVQAGLSYLQKYPELAATLFKVQQVMMITDIIGYAYTTHSLYKRIEAKLGLKNPVAVKAFKVAALATAVAVMALSYYVTLQINTYLQSAIVLKDLLAKLPIAPQVLKNIDISWNSPLSYRLIQSLYINRIVSTVALAFFSTERKAHLLSAAAQIAGLVGTFKLRWIEMAQLDHCNQNAKLIAHFLVDPSCTLEPTHLQSAVQSIYQCVNKLLDKATWHSYWWVNETSRRLMCDVTFPEIPVEACGCGLSASLVNLALTPVNYASKTFIVWRKNAYFLGDLVRRCLAW